MFGLSSLAQFVLGRGEYGTRHTVYWAWGIGAALGIYMGLGVSGGHINPAITLAFATVGKVRWRQVPLYFLAQFLGAFVASAVVYALYMDALDGFDGGVREVDGPNGTAGIWATYPHPDVGIVNCFVDQVIATFMFLLCVCCLVDSRNTRIPGYLRPFMIGLVVFVIGATMVLNTGCALNPARDLSPRVFTAIAGWGTEVFTYRNYFFWVPIVGPLVGGVLGAVTYATLIEMHIPKEKSAFEILDKTVTEIKS